MWLFRRRSGRKRSVSGANLSDAEGQPPSRALTEGDVTRTASIKKQRTDSQRQRRARAYSFSPGRRDSIRVDNSHDPSARGNRAGRPGLPANHDIQERQPTLHHTSRDKRQSTRKKNSKRRRQELDREAEIKALSNFTPVRPATDSWTAGRPMKKESQRARTTPFGRYFDNPASDVSLPLPGSIHSSMSSDSEYGSYKLSALDSLTPRPTLRHAHDQRWASTRSHIPARTGSNKRPIAERVQLPDEKLNSRRRIDELADDLDASDLRELLERDQRRRERKQQRDQEKMERRLARRAEKQRRDEAEAEGAGTPSPENMDRGVLGRESVGLGIDSTSAVVTSSRPRELPSDDPMADVRDDSPKRPSDHFHPVDALPEDEVPHTEEPPLEPQQENEQQDPRGSDLEQTRKAQLTPQAQQPTPAPALSQTSLLSELLRSRKSRSKSTLASDREKNMSPTSGTIPEDKALENDPQTSSVVRRFSLASFWRRTGRTRRNSRQSSFSNTSREEMQAAAASSQASIKAQSLNQSANEGQAQSQAQAQAQALALAKLQGEDATPNAETPTGNYLSRKPSSGVPKRTRSRFREDLPDFPISPPDSRVQSPEVEPPLPSVMEDRPESTAPLPIPSARYSSPTSAHRSMEMMRQTPTSMERASYGIPSPEPHQSISLASIDSEGSWLSGRMASRRTSAIDSIARANRREQRHSNDSPTNSTEEDLGIADDEYLSRLAPRRQSGHLTVGRRSEEGRPSSDEERFEEDGDVRWGAVGARPYVVETHDREMMQSRQGMLNVEADEDVESEHDADVDEASSSLGSPAVEEQPDVRRARSVNLGKGHIRNFSAGSAKLLDITPRSSVDEKRRHREKRRSSPLF